MTAIFALNFGLLLTLAALHSREGESGVVLPALLWLAVLANGAGLLHALLSQAGFLPALLCS